MLVYLGSGEEAVGMCESCGSTCALERESVGVS